MQDNLTPAEIAAALLRQLAEELEERPHETLRSLRQAELAQRRRERERLEEELERIDARLRFLDFEEARPSPAHHGAGRESVRQSVLLQGGFAPEDEEGFSPDGPPPSTTDHETASLTSDMGSGPRESLAGAGSDEGTTLGHIGADESEFESLGSPSETDLEDQNSE